MNVYGRFTAAVGSLALNGVLTLILTQAAGAAVPATTESMPHPPSYGESVQSPHTSYTVTVGADHHSSKAQCAERLRNRAILAVLLGLIV
jgi:hypothetical protein